MALSIEVKERHRHHLETLLTLKKENPNVVIVGLREALVRATAVMEREDILWVEEVVGIKAF
jgi:hypothetical protein